MVSASTLPLVPALFLMAEALVQPMPFRPYQSNPFSPRPAPPVASPSDPWWRTQAWAHSNPNGPGLAQREAWMPSAGLRPNQAVAAATPKSTPIVAANAQRAGSLPSGASELNFGSMGNCLTDGKWPQFTGKFDLVITWWTDAVQSNQMEHNAFPKPMSLLDTGKKSWNGDQARFENQDEITYMLRSFEQNGLMNYVRNVVVLMDAEVLRKYGAPRHLNFTGDRLRVVTDEDIGINNTDCLTATGMSAGCGKWSKRLRMQYIPGLSEYFLYTPDDVFLMKPFDINSLWDARTNKPILYSYGSWIQGSCAGGEPFGSGHGPVLMNRCAMHQAALKNANLGFVGGSMKDKAEVDGICMYSNFVRDFSIYKSYYEASALKFFAECHMNPVERCTIEYALRSGAAFVNIQGDAVSDEQKADAGWQGEAAQIANFFHTNWYQTSSLEHKPEAKIHSPAIRPEQMSILELERVYSDALRLHR